MPDHPGPIPGLPVAGPADLKGLLPMQVAMDYRWLAWFNQRVLEAVKQGWNRRLTHLRFVPDLEQGLLYVLPGRKGEYGSIRLDYSPSEAGAMLSLYVPLLGFDLTRQRGRQRIFPVEPRQVEGVTYMALGVQASRSVPGRGRTAAD